MLLDTPPLGAPWTSQDPLHQTIENALDVPHTAFLHQGLFRGVGEPNEITAVVTRDTTSVQAEFIGEPRPRELQAKSYRPRAGW